MSTDNKRAPKVRSGDEINPVLGSIIKIGGLIIIAALAVVIVFILVEVFKKDTTTPPVFEDSYHLELDDFLILTNPTSELRNFEDLKNDDIKDVMINFVNSGEATEYYIYFYYGSISDNLPEEEVEKLVNMDQNHPLFFVNLDNSVTSPSEDIEMSKFSDIFTTRLWEDTYINTKDDSIIFDQDQVESFVIGLNIEDERDENSGFVNSYYGVELDDIILVLPRKENTEE